MHSRTNRFLSLTLIVLCISAQSVSAEPAKAALHHWPILSFKPYTSAHFAEFPDGDIDPRRAFYFGRVLGSDGLAFNLRFLTDGIHEGNWFEPVYRNEAEKKYLFDLVKRFKDVYTKYGCGDHFLQIHTHGAGPIPVDQWRQNVIEGIHQYAELLNHPGLDRLLLDLEFSHMKDTSTDPRFWYDLGADVARTADKTYPGMRFGFYPGLTHFMYEIERGRCPDGTNANPRVNFLRGVYDNRGSMKIWHFAGWSYLTNDHCTGDRYWLKYSPYVNTVKEMSRLITWSHRILLGPEIEYMWGRWDMGKWVYAAPTDQHELTGPHRATMPKFANQPLTVMQRTWSKFIEKSPAIGVWDHRSAWDEDGSHYLDATDPTVLASFKKALAETRDGAYSHRLFDALTGEYWCAGVQSDKLEDRLELFEFIRKDGRLHVVGKLPDDFADYVNLSLKLVGKDKQAFPLHTEADIRMARHYQKRGFFPDRRITTVKDERWPNAAAVMLGADSKPEQPVKEPDLNDDTEYQPF